MSEIHIQLQELVWNAIESGAHSVAEIHAYVVMYLEPALVTQEYISDFLKNEFDK